MARALQKAQRITQILIKALSGFSLLGLTAAYPQGQVLSANVPLIKKAQDQLHPSIAPDGNGGFFIAWEEYALATGADIFAQHSDGAGNPLWAPGGIPVCTAPHDQLTPAVMPDGSGGAVIAWIDARDAHSTIYAQDVDSAGAMKWAADGVQLVATGDDLFEFSMISDGARGAIFAWCSNTQGSSFADIEGQRIGADGSRLWGDAGKPMGSGSGHAFGVTAVSDGKGGVILAWQGYTDLTSDIYAQHASSDGAPMWQAEGMLVCGSLGLQAAPCSVSDGTGGAIIAWQDARAGSDSAMDIFAQRLDSLGNAVWAVNGVPVCSAANIQTNPEIVTDDAHGAIIAWNDFRSGGAPDIYAQRLDSSGTGRWLFNGIPVCNVSGGQTVHGVLSDRRGGAFIAWDDTRNDAGDVYAQHIGADGAAVWQANGLGISTAAMEQSYPGVAPGGLDGVFISWQDRRNDSDFDIYGEWIGGDGGTSVHLVAFTGSVVEPNDVILEWTTLSERGNQGFQIQRRAVVDTAYQDLPGAFFPGQNSGNQTHRYTYTDHGVGNGAWAYRLVQTDSSGTRHYTEPVTLTVGTSGVASGQGTPVEFALEQNYPNPFNPTTTIRYFVGGAVAPSGASSSGVEPFESPQGSTLSPPEGRVEWVEGPAANHVKLAIYDVLGREVAVLVNERKGPGSYEVRFDGSALASGVYVYRLTAGLPGGQAGSFVESRKMILLK